jgi:hypothetical protein
VKGDKLNCKEAAKAYIGCCRLFNQLIGLVLLPDKKGDINALLDTIELACRTS